MVKAVGVKEVHHIVQCSCDVECHRGNMVCVWLKRTQVDLGRTEMVEDMDKAMDGIVLFI